MNKIRILIIGSIILFASNLFGQNETLQDLINTAIKVSPQIKMLEMKKLAASNRIEQNSNLPDPMLTLGIANLPVNSFSFTQEPMTGKIVGLSQAFPFPGKLSKQAKVNQQDVQIVEQEIIDAKNEIRKNVIRSYNELLYVRKAIQISENSKALLNNIAEVVRTKYSVSTASQQNLLKVELEITNLTEKIVDLKSKENSQIAVLNALLLRPSNSSINTVEIQELNYKQFTVDALVDSAEKYRPFLKGIKEAKQKEELKKSLADYDYYPNFNLSVLYTFRDEIAATNTPLNDFISFFVGISLPLNYGGKVSSKVEETETMQKLYDEQYNMSLQILQSSFGSAIAKINSLKERIKLIEEGSLIQANENLKTTLTSYQVGQVDFLNVIDAQNSLLKIENDLYRLKTDYLNEIAELEFLTGTEFYQEN
ncbi:MAG: TolC family protein [Ignavibacteriaceae bacterium]|nr:TolC family protein [Ignavibacteriaceae bacterium]